MIGAMKQNRGRKQFEGSGGEGMETEVEEEERGDNCVEEKTFWRNERR